MPANICGYDRHTVLQRSFFMRCSNGLSKYTLDPSYVSLWAWREQNNPRVAIKKSSWDILVAMLTHMPYMSVSSSVQDRNLSACYNTIFLFQLVSCLHYPLSTYCNAIQSSCLNKDRFYIRSFAEVKGQLHNSILGAGRKGRKSVFLKKKISRGLPVVLRETVKVLFFSWCNKVKENMTVLLFLCITPFVTFFSVYLWPHKNTFWCGSCPFFCSSHCVPLLFLFLCVSVIPQSDLVHWAKSIATLLEPKPRGSAVALYSLSHQKHRYRIMQWSYRQQFEVTNIHCLLGAIPNESWDWDAQILSHWEILHSGKNTEATLPD